MALSKEQKAAYNRAYSAANREAINAAARVRYAKNPEKARRRTEKWRKANQGSVNAKSREWVKTNPEKRAAIMRKHKYGLTVVEQAALLSNPCEICGGASTCIDHSHVTGKVRGGLCRDCNLGLGPFRDNPLLLESAARYLRKHASQET